MDLTFILLITVGIVVIVFLLMVLIASVRSAGRYTPTRTTKRPKKAKPETVSPKKTKPAKTPPAPKAIEPKPVPEPEPVKPAAAPKAEPVAPKPEPVMPKPAPEPAMPEPESIPEEPKIDAAAEAGPTYPTYSNQRAIDQLGLTQEEADEFVVELIGQIEAEIPNLKSAVAEGDIEKIERVSHMLKGSATSLGEGGIADQLVEFNTYCKHGSDPKVVEGFMKTFHREFAALKTQFGV